MCDIEFLRPNNSVFIAFLVQRFIPAPTVGANVGTWKGHMSTNKAFKAFGRCVGYPFKSNSNTRE